MKKFMMIIISAVLMASFIAGCGSRAILKGKRNSSQGTSASQETTAGTSTQVSKDTSKLTDDDLMSIANDKNETVITQDNVDLDKDISDLDSILNQNDTISDVPKSVNLK